MKEFKSFEVEINISKVNLDLKNKSPLSENGVRRPIVETLKEKLKSAEQEIEKLNTLVEALKPVGKEVLEAQFRKIYQTEEYSELFKKLEKEGVKVEEINTEYFVR